jgi:hypothetical protein
MFAFLLSDDGKKVEEERIIVRVLSFSSLELTSRRR